MLHIRHWLPILITMLWLTNGAAQSISKEVRQDILKAVVQIIPFDNTSGEMAPWSGSGTIISPDGYILTNFHVIGDLDTRQHFEFHAILTTDPNFTDQPPVFSYWARYVASDPTHDLAILKIVEFADETPVPESLQFVSVTVGDSNELFPGDLITIVGYPGISGSTVTFTAGLMSGWLGEDFEAGGKQWIKTDAKIAHGNSGGA
ncbi:MAG: trypsin-like peptidase domain-containing protein, partial [Trueperaceae bacterium]